MNKKSMNKKSMNKKSMNKKSMNFIQQLQHDIKKQNKINQNPELFIKHKNLKFFDGGTPMQLYVGSVYFISNKSIIESYSWVDYNYSTSVKFNRKIPTWLNKITFTTVSKQDLGVPLYNWIKRNNTLDNSFPSHLVKFALSLVNKGFKIYI
jgi:hypothetical protein